MTTNSPKLEQRLARYACLAGAALATSAITTAQADIVYSGPLAIDVPNTLNGIYFNIVTGAFGTSETEIPGFDFGAFNYGAGFTLYGNATPSGIMATGSSGVGEDALRLNQGNLISSAGLFNQFQTEGTQFQSGGQGYLGIQFTNEETGAQNYGWILFANGFASGSNVGFPASILGYGYENTGASIAAGDIGVVPEPSTLTLLGLSAAGAIGLRTWRRRETA